MTHLVTSTAWHKDFSNIFFYKKQFIIIIVATAGTPPQAESVKVSGDIGRQTPVKIPLISITTSDKTPISIVKKALFKGFFFFAIKNIIEYSTKDDRAITAKCHIFI